MKNKKEPKETIKGRSKQPKSRLAGLTPKKAVNEAQRIIKVATDILEEEVAAGIIAAKEMEKKVIDVDKARNKDNDHVISRFRSDAHEVIDIFMDVVSAASSQLENISDRLVNISPEKSNSNSVDQIPVISSDVELEPGKSVAIKMQLQNDNAEKSMKVEMIAGDFTSPSGGKILSRNITISPETLKIKPGEKEMVEIMVNAPKSTKKGKYSAFIQDKNIDNLQAMLKVDVKDNE
ncbi:COG1470 family protein [Mangrovivirga cuniculi]|uniref:Uncharacterized protein n=1 Tax=Mangrovivirga cuniculi TaxID=2715131 RepID=A0A4D7JYJ9_9BACT|nr:hypothetical protein [Mangrovivirga cuniculi]QCK15775.1 hypothetical protein DCC35_13985 [Mangrovivirga cuniculi]